MNGGKMTRQQRRAWQRRMGAFIENAAGVMEARIVRPDIADTPETAGPVLEFLTMLRHEGFPQPPLCLACEAEFNKAEKPAACSVVLPFRDGPTHALVTGICVKCARKSDEELQALTIQGMKRLYPDLRQIDVSKQSGRA